MIVAITGSRDNVGPSVVERGLRLFIEQRVTPHTDHAEFRCGDARGVDLYARDWLRRSGYVVDVYCASDSKALLLELMIERQRNGASVAKLISPHTYRRIIRSSDWDRDGKDAGRIRNAQMLQRPELAHLLIKFHDGFSPGTRNCADLAEQLGIEVVDRGCGWS